jgi:hypothetical protein
MPSLLFVRCWSSRASGVSFVFPCKPKKPSQFTQRFFVTCITSIAERTSRNFQYSSSQNIDFFFHMGACPLASFGTERLPGPFPKITFKSLTISNISSPVWRLGLPRTYASPLKCLPFFFNWCLGERNRWCPKYTTFLLLSKYILSISPKQCVHALYPLFVCPERLLRAGQSLMVTNSNARRSNSSYLYSSHTRTPSVYHSCLSSSTNGLRYTSMSLPGCFGPWISTGIIINFRFMHNQGGRL